MQFNRKVDARHWIPSPNKSSERSYELEVERYLHPRQRLIPENLQNANAEKANFALLLWLKKLGFLLSLYFGKSRSFDGLVETTRFLSNSAGAGFNNC